LRATGGEALLVAVVVDVAETALTGRFTAGDDDAAAGVVDGVFAGAGAGAPPVAATVPGLVVPGGSPMIESNVSANMASMSTTKSDVWACAWELVALAGAGVEVVDVFAAAVVDGAGAAAGAAALTLVVVVDVVVVVDTGAAAGAGAA